MHRYFSLWRKGKESRTHTVGELCIVQGGTGHARGDEKKLTNATWRSLVHYTITGGHS